jgi:hypothetical protein
VVTGPSLHGFILHHREAPAHGKSIPVRMIVMTKKDPYGFQIRRLARRPRLATLSSVCNPEGQLCGAEVRRCYFCYGSAAPVRSLGQQTYGQRLMPPGMARQ